MNTTVLLDHCVLSVLVPKKIQLSLVAQADQTIGQFARKFHRPNNSAKKIIERKLNNTLLVNLLEFVLNAKLKRV